MKAIYYIVILCGTLFLSAPISAVSAELLQDNDFILAKRFFHDGFYDIAAKTLEKFITDNPNDSDILKVRLLLAESYTHLERYNDAIRELAFVISSKKAGELKVEAIYWKAEVYLRTRDFEKAREFYNQVVSDFPLSAFVPQAKYSIAWSLYEEKKYKEAVDKFLLFAADHPASDLKDEVELRIGEIFYKLKQYEMSKDRLLTFMTKTQSIDKKILKKAYFYIAEDFYYMGDYDKAIKYYESAISIEVDGLDTNVYAMHGKAWSYMKKTEYANAIRLFGEMKSLGEKNPIVDSVLFGEAEAFGKLGHFEEALKNYTAIIAEYPKSKWLPDSYLRKSEALYQLGKYDEALAALKQGVRLFGTGEYADDMYYNMGWIYFKVSKFKEAIEEFRKVIKSSHSDFYLISSYCRMGDAYAQIGELEKAAQVYDLVLKEATVNPEAVFGYVDYAQYQTGRILFKLERYEGVILAFQSLLRNYPDSSNAEDARFGLAVAYFKKGDYPSSIRELGSFLKMYKDSKYKIEAKFYLASALYNLGNYKSALQIFKEVSSMESDMESGRWAFYEIGWCYYKLEDSQKAINQFELFLKKYPDDDLAQDARFWMGEYYADNGDMKKAERYFHEIVSMSPKGSLADDAEYRIAMLFYESGDESKGIRMLKRIKKYYPESELMPTVNLKIAEMLIKEGAFIEAKDLLDTVMSDFEGTFYVNVASKYMGDILRKERELGKAIEYYKKALDNRRGDFNANLQYMIGQLYAESGDYDNAVSEYMKVGYIYPDSTSIVVDSQLDCAKIFENMKKWNEAEKLYRKIALMDVKESDYARERVNWILRNKQ